MGSKQKRVAGCYPLLSTGVQGGLGGMRGRDGQALCRRQIFLRTKRSEPPSRTCPPWRAALPIAELLPSQRSPLFIPSKATDALGSRL